VYSHMFQNEMEKHTGDNLLQILRNPLLIME
jgi:hypothetical protein